MKKLGGGIVITEICVYEKEMDDIGIEVNEWRKMHLDIGSIVTLRDFDSKNPQLNGFPIISCTDGESYVLKELHEDILEEWINHKKI